MKELVRMLEEGICYVGMRLKGPTTKAFALEFTTCRKKVVELIKEANMLVEDKCRAVSVEKWKKSHPGKDPIKEGHLIRNVPVQGRGLVECVMLRHPVNIIMPDLATVIPTSLNLAKQIVTDASPIIKQ